METKRIAVLIPCYNEEATISKVVKDFRDVLPDADIYVFDNNSSDATSEKAREAGAIVVFEERRGKGNVVRTMFRTIKADCYIMVDGDDTYPAECAPQMCRWVLEEHVDMVVGDRLSSTYYQENKRPFHNFGNSLVLCLINMIFGSEVKDVMTGYRAFSPFYVKNFPILSREFEIETEMTIHALDKNMLVRSFPIPFRDRPEGSESKLNTFRDGYKVLLTVFLLFRDYKPITFFSLFALIFFICSAVLLVPVLMQYCETGMVPRFPSLVVSGIFFMSSLLSLACGIVLDVIRKKHLQLFELLANR